MLSARQIEDDDKLVVPSPLQRPPPPQPKEEPISVADIRTAPVVPVPPASPEPPPSEALPTEVVAAEPEKSQTVEAAPKVAVGATDFKVTIRRPKLKG